MKFTKMHGIGNDYVYINCFEEEVKNPEALAKFVSNRNFGVGSDGLILIRPSDKADFRMEIYNSDGSQAEMCGNGIRCVGKYVYDHGLTDQTEITVDTLGGIKRLKLTVEDGKVSLVRVNMGEPVFDPEKIPVRYKENPVVNVPIEVNGREYHITCVSMGNPNCVVMMEEISKNKALHLGPYVENSKYFPNRINMQLCHVVDRENIQIEIYERGAGYTYASGTGACAAASAAHKLGLVGNRVQVHMQGGDLLVEFAEDDRVFMTGPVVYIGSITLAENFFA